MDPFQYGLIFGLSLCAAISATGITLWFSELRPRRRDGLFREDQTEAVFLFDDDILLDATGAARDILAAQGFDGSDWQRFLKWSAPRFPDIESRLNQLDALGYLETEDTRLLLRAEWRGGLRRIALTEKTLEPPDRLISLAQRAQEDEFDLLREVINDMPIPIWRESATGSVVWANGAYCDLAFLQAAATKIAPWPIPKLFPDAGDERAALSLPNEDQPRWFDCHMTNLSGERTGFAIPADRIVQAEKALGNFVQTLTKTFAHLPIGLAVFDPQRKLQLFNPALTDLTQLPVDFLMARPSFFAFFDAMRERGMIPEPRDYKSWRAQMAALERSARDGTYEETWTLAPGVTYRVMGRPHTEGALALLFQDITDEIASTRRMRADLELGQSVIDTTDESIAVFSSSGILVMSNTAYTRLWGEDPSSQPSAISIAALAEQWKHATATSSFWATAVDYVNTNANRTPIKATARLNDGRGLACRLTPLAGGATLIGFCVVTESALDESRSTLAPDTSVTTKPRLPAQAAIP